MILKISQDMLAEMACTMCAGVSFLLNKFSEAGLLRVQRGRPRAQHLPQYRPARLGPLIPTDLAAEADSICLRH